MVVGVWLITRNELSIGALFAFRIISGKVTGPMIQLVQTWQQFKIQSRNLTLAADVVDRPTEQTDLQATNIPMPPLRGQVCFEGVNFRYADQGPQILNNVSLDVAEGTFVGMVEAPDPANQLCSSCCRASTAPIAVGSRSMAWTSAKWSCIPCVARSVWSPRTPCYSMARSKTTC